MSSNINEATVLHGLVREHLETFLAAAAARRSVLQTPRAARYLAIGRVVRELPGARLLACTATAAPIVRTEILAALGLDRSTPQIVHGFARPNLTLNVHFHTLVGRSSAGS